MQPYKTQIFDHSALKKNYPNYVLGADIGGTKTNLTVAAQTKNNPILLYSHHYQTQNLTSLIPAIQHTLTYAKKTYNHIITTACIGAAGIISPHNDYAELTNIPWNISKDGLLQHTQLKNLTIINDFQALGYAINILNHENPDHITPLTPQNTQSTNGPKALIGAGTGLGKSILYYDTTQKAYIPQPSEGGHSDFPAYTNQDHKLIAYLQTKKQTTQPIKYEDLLSGRGLISIYEFIRTQNNFPQTRYTQEIDSTSDKTPLISKYQTQDPSCKQCFQLFTQYYARCAKNYVLDTFATGGLYIAGGIAIKNPSILSSPIFHTEFQNSSTRKNILKQIPIFLIKNYDASLFGACYAAMYYSIR